MGKGRKKMRVETNPMGALKLTKGAKSHIPQLVRKETAVQPGGRIPFIIGARAVLLYDPTLDPEGLLASVEALKQNLYIRFNKTPRTGASEGDVRSVAGKAVGATPD